MINSQCFELVGDSYQGYITQHVEFSCSTEFGAKSAMQVRKGLMDLNQSLVSPGHQQFCGFLLYYLICLTFCLALGCGTTQREDSGPGTKV